MRWGWLVRGGCVGACQVSDEVRLFEVFVEDAIADCRAVSTSSLSRERGTADTPHLGVAAVAFVSYEITITVAESANKWKEGEGRGRTVTDVANRYMGTWVRSLLEVLFQIYARGSQPAAKNEHTAEDREPVCV